MHYNTRQPLSIQPPFPVFGDPVDPTWPTVRQHFFELAERRPPRTFLQIFDVREGISVLSKGLSLLGYPDDWLFTVSDTLARCHENQRRLLRYQTESVYRVFAEKPHLIKGKKVTYCNIRTFRDAHGQYWRVHQASSPAQYDARGQLVRYLSYYTLLGKYNGEPFETEIYTDPRFPKEEQELMRELQRIKQGWLAGLGFSKKEEAVIRLMAVTDSKKDIAESMDIHPRTVDKHRLSILEKGRDIFPLNDFSTAQDVVRYLERQWLL